MYRDPATWTKIDAAFNNRFFFSFRLHWSSPTPPNDALTITIVRRTRYHCRCCCVLLHNIVCRPNDVERSKPADETFRIHIIPRYNSSFTRFNNHKRVYGFNRDVRPTGVHIVSRGSSCRSTVVRKVRVRPVLLRPLHSRWTFEYRSSGIVLWVHTLKFEHFFFFLFPFLQFLNWCFKSVSQIWRRNCWNFPLDSPGPPRWRATVTVSTDLVPTCRDWWKKHIESFDSVL